MFQGESIILRENVPCVKLPSYKQKRLYPNSNGYGDNSEIVI
jgi:hypothetical protein